MNRGVASPRAHVSVVAALTLVAGVSASAHASVTPRTASRIGPTCRVNYAPPIDALKATAAPHLAAAARSGFAGAREHLARGRVWTGIVPHEGPVTVTERDLAAALPASVKMPASLDRFDFVFLKAGDPRSQEALEALAKQSSHRTALAFFVDISGDEFATARQDLPSSFRGAFPATAAWAAFLGVRDYPAVARVHAGRVRVLSGDWSREDLVTHGF